jgi:hypothetical protein
MWSGTSGHCLASASTQLNAATTRLLCIVESNPKRQSSDRLYNSDDELHVFAALGRYTLQMTGTAI